jgi:tRNA/rRNA methyltransferase
VAANDSRDDAATNGRGTALDRVRVVLVRTTLPANIGAAARAMYTMGLTRLVLVAPVHFPHADATALARGATRVLDGAQVVPTLDLALAGTRMSIGLSARPRHFAGRVLSVRDAARAAAGIAAVVEPGDGPASPTDAREANASTSEPSDVALVFGTEMSGLTNEELARCTAVCTISANPAYPSLNLAAAVQVAAWEVRVAALGDDVWSPPRFASATHDDIAALLAHAERTLVALRFLDPARPRRLMPRLRRLFARAGLEREEVNILRGILARIDVLLQEVGMR